MKISTRAKFGICIIYLCMIVSGYAYEQIVENPSASLPESYSLSVEDICEKEDVFWTSVDQSEKTFSKSKTKDKTDR